ncbi:MAG TPA: transketolase [Dehalococcoidia bacterium]|nr:transketolase [Dehalococcoidia bacterium]
MTIEVDLLERLKERAQFIRIQTVDLINIARNGHYSSTFSAAELFSTLYYHTLNIDPKRPDWPERDRFVLSKGHAMIGIYPVLADLGYFDASELETYTRFGSAFADHADMTKCIGADFSNGSLGHGLSVGVGMALAGRTDALDYRVWVMTGDGELAEGMIWEAAMTASQYKLGNLVWLVDKNQMGLDGYTEDVMNIDPLDEKIASFGFDVQTIDGHNLEQIVATFDALLPTSGDRPQAIIANTIKGKGVGHMELNPAWHVGGPIEGDAYDAIVSEIRGETSSPQDYWPRGKTMRD